MSKNVTLKCNDPKYKCNVLILNDLITFKNELSGDREGVGRRLQGPERLPRLPGGNPSQAKHGYSRTKVLR